MDEQIVGWFNSIVNDGVSIIWGNNDWLIVGNPWYGLLMFVLIGAGLYFTIATRFVQFRYFGHMWKLLRTSNQGRKDGGISSFEALMTSLAARVGTGNLAGGSDCYLSRWTWGCILDVDDCDCRDVY